MMFYMWATFDGPAAALAKFDQEAAKSAAKAAEGSEQPQPPPGEPFASSFQKCLSKDKVVEILPRADQMPEVLAGLIAEKCECTPENFEKVCAGLNQDWVQQHKHDGTWLVLLKPDIKNWVAELQPDDQWGAEDGQIAAEDEDEDEDEGPDVLDKGKGKRKSKAKAKAKAKGKGEAADGAEEGGGRKSKSHFVMCVCTNAPCGPHAWLTCHSVTPSSAQWRCTSSCVWHI